MELLTTKLQVGKMSLTTAHAFLLDSGDLDMLQHRPDTFFMTAILKFFRSRIICGIAFDNTVRNSVVTEGCLNAPLLLLNF